WYPVIAVLKTTSPPVSPSAPNAVPWNTVPSARARIAGFDVVAVIVACSAPQSRRRSSTQPRVEGAGQPPADAGAGGAAAALHTRKRRVPRARLEARRVDAPADLGVDERYVGGRATREPTAFEAEDVRRAERQRAHGGDDGEHAGMDQRQRQRQRRLEADDA